MAYQQIIGGSGMRPIKFRAWEKNMNAMIPVENIDFLAKQINTNSAWRMFHEIELMQYTGLKDKNGVEIYEGDIVNITQYFGGHPYGETKHIIKRSKYTNNLVADSESGDWRTPEVSMTFRSSDDYEVIGNVYEDKELLGEEE